VDGGTVGLLQSYQHADGLQEMNELIQHRPFIEPLDPIHQVLTVQAACDPELIAPCDLPTPPLRQVRRDVVVRVPHGPPSSLGGLPALEERGPSIKVLAYVGTSGRFSLAMETDKMLGFTI
jgi:hypothetical protein